MRQNKEGKKEGFVIKRQLYQSQCRLTADYLLSFLVLNNRIEGQN